MRSNGILDSIPPSRFIFIHSFVLSFFLFSWVKLYMTPCGDNSGFKLDVALQQIVSVTCLFFLFSFILSTAYLILVFLSRSALVSCRPVFVLFCFFSLLILRVRIVLLVVCFYSLVFGCIFFGCLCALTQVIELFGELLFLIQYIHLHLDRNSSFRWKLDTQVHLHSQGPFCLVYNSVICIKAPLTFIFIQSESLLLFVSKLRKLNVAGKNI